MKTTSILLVLIALTAFNAVTADMTATQMSASRMLFIQRDAVRRHMIESAREAVAKSGDPVAKMILEHIEKHHALGISLPSGGISLLEPMGTNVTIALVPILHGDDVGESAMGSGKTFHNHLLGSCTTTTNGRTTIFVRLTDNHSTFSTGTTLLHEGFHAYSAHTNGGEWRTYDEKMQNEVDARKFDIRIAKAIGKDKYEQVVSNIVCSTMSDLKEKKLRIGDVFTGPEPYDPLLDQALSPAKSDEDRNGRRTTVTTDVNFRLLSMEYTGKELAHLERAYVHSLQPGKQEYIK